MSIIRTIIASLLLCGAAWGQMGANLVPVSSATHTAVASGSWQDAATWGGAVPPAGAKVYIPPGITVKNDGTTADVLWVHVAGKLTFCDHCDTHINVHTLYVPMGGSFSGHTTGKCVTEFTPGPFLPGDATQLSRGLICHGEFMVSGVEKTACGEVLADLPVGATSLKVASAAGWNVGDRLIVTGTDSVIGEDLTGHRYQSEFVTVTNVAADGTVTFNPPLAYRHFRWRPDLPFHVGNLTRNVVFRSRDTSTIANRGHLMFMSSMCDMRYVAVEGCGRTDGSQPVTDPRFDAYGEFIPGSDANVRARYAVHWHRIGQLSKPAIAIGCVVDGSPKWGFLNHASNVHLRDCVAVRCFGSGFATEEGQERGSFDRCLSVLNRGLGDTVSSTDADHGRFEIGDWGIDGSGFWLQGGGVSVTNCVAADNSGRGFALFNQALNAYPDHGSTAQHIRFPIEVDATLLPLDYFLTSYYQNANPKPAAIPSMYVPQLVFAKNTAYGNKLGIQGWSGTVNQNNTPAYWPASVRADLSDVTLWGRGAFLHLEYMQRANVSGLRVVGDDGIHYAYLSTNRHEPILCGSPYVKITGTQIEGTTRPIGMLRYTQYGSTIEIDGTHPIIDANTGAWIRQ